MLQIDTTRHPSPTPHVLATLAHLGCATLPQLHALCFPEAVASTVRLALMALMEAGLITHSHWRLRSGPRCQVWTITTKGLAHLRQELPTAPQLHPPDLNRPSTPGEMEEWRVRIEVRTLLIQLILAARQRPLCAGASLSASVLYPTPLPIDHAPQPDAVLAIAWEPATRQATNWLPWLDPTLDTADATRYLLYVERQGQRRAFETGITQGMQDEQEGLPLLILATPERCAEVASLLREHVLAGPIRLCARDELERGLLHAPWHDGQGRASTLAPEPVKRLI